MKKLYIEQKLFKIEDLYPIYDENEVQVYFVDESFKFFEKHYEITNSKTGEVILVDKVFPTLFPEFTVTFPDESILTLKSMFSIFSKYIEVLPKNEDIHIKGNFLSYDFEIYKVEDLIGSIERELFRMRDCYCINVIDDKYEGLFIAMMIAIDNILDGEKNN